MTADVQDWLDGEPNNGWVLRLSSGNDLILNLGSGEHQDASVRPQLTITLPTGTLLATTTPTATVPPTPTPDVQGGVTTFNLPLNSGWSAFSIPVVPTNPSLPDVLASLDGHLVAVRWFDNTVEPPVWRHYVPGAGDNDLPGIWQAIGVWVQTDAAAVLSVNGYRLTTPTVMQLQPGWNQIGFPSLAPQRVDATLADIAGKFDHVRVWDNDTEQWRSFVPGDPGSTLTAFQPGDAIWIHATQAATLTIVN